MNKPFLSLLELLYLYYMFIIFKTTFTINHPLETKMINKLNKISDKKIFYHPISSSKYESKICPFGKKVIYLLLLFLIYRIFNPNLPKKINLWILIITIFMSLLNLNALLYILPYIIIEINYFI